MADSLPVHFGRGGGRQGNYHRGGGGRGRYQHRGGGGRGRGRYNNHRGRGRGGRGRGRGGGGRGRWNRADELFEEHGTPTDTSVSIAVQGCCHGELETIYARLSEFQQQTGRKIDVLICCGDFQSLRTPADFHSYAAPPKYRQLGGFVKYYSGVLVAPILTIFIGGNHESSQALQELYYGGWVAPNIYYMGAAGVVSVKGVRIGGISGIYKSHDYHKGHFERPPYDRSTLRSVYHVRSLPVFRMKSLSGQQKQRLDVMMSHDWPQGIENHGNIRYLLQKKPYFREEVHSNTLGSPANHEILQAIKPKLWFSAHLHVGFRATVRHDDPGNNKKDDNDNKKAQPTLSTTDLVPSQAVKPAASPSKEEDTNEETKDGADEAPATSPAQEESTKDGDSAAPPAANDSKETTEEAAEDPSQQLLCQPVSETRFVSLDKCLPGRPYFSVTHVEPSQPSNNHAVPTLEYDPEWLAILRKTHDLTEPNNRRQVLPKDLMPVTQAEIDAVKQLLLESRNDLAIPHNFSVTVPPSGHSSRALPPPLPRMGNPQTDELLELLKLDHLITIPYDPSCLQGLDWSQPPQGPPPPPQPDDNEIDIDGDDDEEEDVHKEETVDDGKGKGVADENEIDVDEVSEDDDGGSSPKRPRLES